MPAVDLSTYIYLFNAVQSLKVAFSFANADFQEDGYVIKRNQVPVRLYVICAYVPYIKTSLEMLASSCWPSETCGCDQWLRILVPFTDVAGDHLDQSGNLANYFGTTFSCKRRMSNLNALWLISTQSHVSQEISLTSFPKWMDKLRKIGKIYS